MGAPHVDRVVRKHQCFANVEIWVSLLLAAGIRDADGSWRGDSSEAVGDKVMSYRTSDYWDALAPHHSALENNYFDRSGLRRIIDDIHQPVLVVGAGQGGPIADKPLSAPVDGVLRGCRRLARCHGGGPP